VFVMALAVIAATLFVAGATKNAEISNLRQHGVRVEATVQTCTGQLAGSGSNAAAYRCTGTFVLDGQRVRITIPGGALRTPGTKVLLVSTVNDPGLVATVDRVNSERTSMGVFVVPSILLLALIVLIAVVIVRRRRATSVTTPNNE
jgi:hypothetical protein